MDTEKIPAYFGGYEMAAMKSAASYWKPLFNILESSGLKAMVVNASHMKAVPYTFHRIVTTLEKR